VVRDRIGTVIGNSVEIVIRADVHAVLGVKGCGAARTRGILLQVATPELPSPEREPITTASALILRATSETARK
jgi:hypothetical protein